MNAWYNEIDPYAAQWLRNLIAAGHIPAGVVDERDIRDVSPVELAGYDQCHFFAGIGGWPLALAQAGWGDRPVWTGSCPCQPFSAAGKGGGFDDERHLWPAWHHLIEQCAPETVLGEQVASKDGLAWLDLVQADMEGAGYAFAAVDMCAAGIGAPHIRQRLWFVAHSNVVADDQGSAFDGGRNKGSDAIARPGLGDDGVPFELADADDAGSQGRIERGDGSDQRAVGPIGVAGGLADADGRNPGAERLQRGGEHGQRAQDAGVGDVRGLEHAGSVGRQRREAPAPGHVDDGQAPDRPRGQHGLGVASAHWVHSDGTGPVNGFWRDADWLLCRDGKWRPVEPGTFPLAHGVPGRVGRLRAYGNAIAVPLTVEFVAAVHAGLSHDQLV